MASAGSRARRNQEARQRLNAALAAISKRLDIPAPGPSRRTKDPALQPIVEIERFARFAEAVEARLAALAAGDAAPGGYESWTVAMLREEIARRGLDVPSGAVKADLVAILEADDETPDEGPDEDDEGDGGAATEDESP